jgi:hypothetical protein
MVVGASKLYNLYGLVPGLLSVKEQFPSGDPTHFSDSRATWSAYFYKVVTLFAPMYLCLFLAMILFATAMIDNQTASKTSLYVRVVLGCSAVFFFWLWKGMGSCNNFVQSAFRARRISLENPWPLFPEEAELKLYGGREFICRVFAALSVLISLVSILDLIVFTIKHWSMPAASYNAALQPWEKALAVVAVSVFLIWWGYLEFDIRYVLKQAKDYWPAPHFS